MTNYLPGGYESELSDDDYGAAYLSAKKKYSTRTSAKTPLELKKEKLMKLLGEGDLSGIKEELDHGETKGFDIDSNLDSCWNMLYKACFLGNPDIVEYLIEDRGANVNLTRDSETPLMVACTSRADSDKVLSVVKVLIDKSSNMRSSNAFGVTALMNACRHNHLSVVKYLLSKNDSFDAIDNEGRNALFHAIDGKSVSIAKLLIASGIDISVVNKFGSSASDYARCEEQNEIFDLFPKEDEVYQPPCDFLAYNQFDDLIPGLGAKSDVPAYFPDIVPILFGMNCEHFVPKFAQAGTTLEKFLNINDEFMKSVGVEYPFERNIIKLGLLNFHNECWTKKSLHLPFDLNGEMNQMDLVMAFANILRQLVVIKSQISYIERIGEQCDLTETYKYFSLKELNKFQKNVKALEKILKEDILELPKNRPLLISKKNVKSGRSLSKVTKVVGTLCVITIPIVVLGAIRKLT